MKKIYIPIFIVGVCFFSACKDEHLKNNQSNSDKSPSQISRNKIEAGDVARINFSAIGYYAVSQGETRFLYWPTKTPPKNPDELMVLPADVEFYSVGISPTRGPLGFDLPPHMIGYSIDCNSVSNDTKFEFRIYFTPIANTNPQVYKITMYGPIDELIDGKIPYDYCEFTLPNERSFFFRFDSKKKREEIEAQSEALRRVLSDSNSAWPTEINSTAFLVFSSGKRNCTAKFTNFDSKTGDFLLTISDASKPSDSIEFDGKWSSARRLVLKHRGDNSEWSLIYKGDKLEGEKFGELSGVRMIINVSSSNTHAPVKK